MYNAEDKTLVQNSLKLDEHCIFATYDVKYMLHLQIYISQYKYLST